MRAPADPPIADPMMMPVAVLFLDKSPPITPPAVPPMAAPLAALLVLQEGAAAKIPSSPSPNNILLVVFMIFCDCLKARKSKTVPELFPFDFRSVVRDGHGESAALLGREYEKRHRTGRLGCFLKTLFAGGRCPIKRRAVFSGGVFLGGESLELTWGETCAV